MEDNHLEDNHREKSARRSRRACGTSLGWGPAQPIGSAVPTVPPVAVVNQRSLGQRMKDIKLITGMYSGKLSEDVYEFAAEYKD